MKAPLPRFLSQFLSLDVRRASHLHAVDGHDLVVFCDAGDLGWAPRLDIDAVHDVPHDPDVRALWPYPEKTRERDLDGRHLQVPALAPRGLLRLQQTGKAVGTLWSPSTYFFVPAPLAMCVYYRITAYRT